MTLVKSDPIANYQNVKKEHLWKSNDCIFIIHFPVIAMDGLTYNYVLPRIEQTIGRNIQVEHITPLDDYHVGFGVLNKSNPYYKMQKEFNEYSQEDLPLSKV